MVNSPGSGSQPHASKKPSDDGDEGEDTSTDGDHAVSGSMFAGDIDDADNNVKDNPQMLRAHMEHTYAGSIDKIFIKERKEMEAESAADSERKEAEAETRARDATMKADADAIAKAKSQTSETRRN